MYKIIGQPINFRYLGISNLVEKAVPEKPLSEEARRIIMISEFGLKHGYEAAIDAYRISKTTYYAYLKKYKLNKDEGLPIEIKSKRPNQLRTKCWNSKIVWFVCKMRHDHPNIGKDKIKYYLDIFCAKRNIKSVSTGTIQNIINSYPNKLRTKKSTLDVKRRKDVIRKPANYKAVLTGECISLDSIEFRQDGKKSYVVVAQDEATNLLYAKGTNSHTSRSAKAILDEAHNYLPWEKFNTVLTDNGSEFAKDFAKHLQQENIIHYHTYPKTPKQNARCERVNRTIQDEFMIKHANLLFENISLFNKKLDKYLHWYNFERVHYRFGNKMTPFQRHRQLVECGKIVT